MNQKPDKNSEYRSLKIEGTLPLKAVGVECLKESNPEIMSPHRYLFKWFARRPTAATRLAVLASVLPDNVSDDELLQLMQVSPDRPDLLDGSISDYVLKKRSEWDNVNSSLEEHYGYPLPHSQTPSAKEFQELHKTLKEHWGGELPTVLDPTAGGGTIPMESLRYGLPTEANELNPVPWLINKVILEYAPYVGSLEDEVWKWADKIDEEATKQLKEYYPSVHDGQEPSYYFCAYSIECSSCGKRLPLSNRWWFHQESSSKGHAFRPNPKEDKVEYEHLYLPDDITKDEFDPTEGTVSGGDATCPSCGVVTESSDVKSKLRSGDFEYEICGIKYTGTSSNSDDGFRAPTEKDREGFKKAAERIENDIDLATLLTSEIPEGNKTKEPRNYGITKWRETLNPRQFLSQAVYLDVYQDLIPEIKSEYDEETAEAIIVLLALGPTKLLNRNTRLEPIDIRRATPNTMLGSNNFAFQWQYPESNPTVGEISYKSTLDKILEKYEELVEYFDTENLPEVNVHQGDAADLPHDSDSIEAVVVDPPYGDNIMYAELSDVLYVWLREYLQSEMPNEFSATLTNKEDEAVENIAQFDDEDVNSVESASSRSELANRFYEQKMANIFQESYRVLQPGGVLTVYFTEKEVDAWDSLTMSLIRAGFSITATHPVSSEMPQRVGMRGSASADTTLLLTCRKPLNPRPPEERERTLWSNIRNETRTVASEKATELLESDMNLTKTDTIISAFGPTLRVFTENFPVVNKHGDEVRPKEALQEARTAVIDVLVDRELEHTLDGVDDLSKWYILSWLVYEREKIPHDEARQLGIGVGVYIDEIKRDTKIWSKSGEDLILKGHDDRVQDFDELKAGGKRRKRKYPVNPQDVNFDYDIDAVHAALNVLDSEGGNTTWNWLQDRNLADDPVFKRVVKSLIQVLPEDHNDRELLEDLVVGKTGDLLDVDVDLFENKAGTTGSRITDFEDN
jgi:adenine-specific DNA methylase